MKKKHPGLNELMIVNPGIPGQEKALSLGQLFLGEDGTVYQMQGPEENEPLNGLAEFYLGEDGTLYRLEGLGVAQESLKLGEPDLSEAAIGRYFLEEDGTLYEVFQNRKLGSWE